MDERSLQEDLTGVPVKVSVPTLPPTCCMTLSNLLALSGFSHRSKWRCLLVDNPILSCSNNLCFPPAVKFVCGRQLPATDSSLLYSLSILRKPRACCHYQLGLKQKSCSSHAIYCLIHWREKKAHKLSDILLHRIHMLCEGSLAAWSGTEILWWHQLTAQPERYKGGCQN